MTDHYIPHDILGHIFTFSDNGDLYNATQVCQLFYDIGRPQIDPLRPRRSGEDNLTYVLANPQVGDMNDTQMRVLMLCPMPAHDTIMKLVISQPNNDHIRPNMIKYIVNNDVFFREYTTFIITYAIINKQFGALAEVIKHIKGRDHIKPRMDIWKTLIMADAADVLSATTMNKNIERPQFPHSMVKLAAKSSHPTFLFVCERVKDTLNTLTVRVGDILCAIIVSRVDVEEKFRALQKYVPDLSPKHMCITPTITEEDIRILVDLFRRHAAHVTNRVLDEAEATWLEQRREQ
jgi:hypothetical protein